MFFDVHARWLAVFWVPAPLLAAPIGTNTGFENGLAGWTSSNVVVETGGAFEGTKRLNLKNGFVSQTFSGLVVGLRYTVRFAYLAQAGTGNLADARVTIGGVTIGEIHNGQTNEYLSCNGFEFISAATTAVLRVESLAACRT